MVNVPLFNFAFHPYPDWLKRVAQVAKPEPWGTNLKTLELYLRCNYEIAKDQKKVYEDKSQNIAFWRAGSLVNMSADPVWLIYHRNTRDDPYWKLDKVTAGDAPLGLDAKLYEITYAPPPFNRDWVIHFEQSSIQHILGDERNRKRLEAVFSDSLGGKFNEHLIFRAIYGEIQLKRKEEVVLPQWYRGDYMYLMPLFLTQSTKVDLTAALEPDPTMRRYVVRTLLLPYFAYAYARAIVKSRASFADWMMLSEEELNKAVPEEEPSDMA